MRWPWLDERRKARVAMALWVALAVVVWNVVFDVEIIAAGRHYLDLARLHAIGRGAAVRINDVMLPAQRQALVVATLSAGPLLALGLLLIAKGAKRKEA